MIDLSTKSKPPLIANIACTGHSPLVLCAEVDKAESAPMNSLYELFEEFGIFFLSQYHKQFWGLYRQ